MKAARANAPQPAAAVRGAIVASVQQFVSGGALGDDIALIVLKRE